MSETLGKMEKPEAGQFKNGRKLFFVPLIFKPMEEVASLSELAAKYWSEVETQLNNLELKLSAIKKIYHELLLEEDDAKRLKDVSIGSQRIVESLMSKGATLVGIEDSTILAEFIDWGHCLSIGMRSAAVFGKVYEAHQEAGRKRDEHIAKRIDETLKEDEAAVFFMREGHHVQFPADIQVFYVAPPSLDAFHRAQSQHQEKLFGETDTHDHDEAKPADKSESQNGKKPTKEGEE